jgi:mannose-6-phosphate isomerase
LQCHPNARQAEEGFARENDAGIALSSPHRNYKDPRHKPELIMALTNFSAMCGFLPYARIVARLQHYRIDDLLTSFKPFAQSPQAATLAELFTELFELPESERRRAIRRVVGRARLDVEDQNSRAMIGSWLIKLTELYESDPGILAASGPSIIGRWAYFGGSTPIAASMFI